MKETTRIFSYDIDIFINAIDEEIVKKSSEWRKCLVNR
jgi:hypothetical protein